MNKALEHAVAAAATLPNDAPETIAALTLEEMEAERGWIERFARSERKLRDLTRQARERYAAGETTELRFSPIG